MGANLFQELQKWVISCLVNIPPHIRHKNIIHLYNRSPYSISSRTSGILLHNCLLFIKDHLISEQNVFHNPKMMILIGFNNDYCFSHDIVLHALIKYNFEFDWQQCILSCHCDTDSTGIHIWLKLSNVFLILTKFIQFLVNNLNLLFYPVYFCCSSTSIIF